MAPLTQLLPLSRRVRFGPRVTIFIVLLGVMFATTACGSKTKSSESQRSTSSSSRTDPTELTTQPSSASRPTTQTTNSPSASESTPSTTTTVSATACELLTEEEARFVLGPTTTAGSVGASQCVYSGLDGREVYLNLQASADVQQFVDQYGPGSAGLGEGYAIQPANASGEVFGAYMFSGQDGYSLSWNGSGKSPTTQQYEDLLRNIIAG